MQLDVEALRARTKRPERAAFDGAAEPGERVIRKTRMNGLQRPVRRAYSDRRNDTDIDPKSLPRVSIGDVVDGLTVRDKVPTKVSLEVLLDSWEEIGIRAVPVSEIGIRAVPVSAFEDSSAPSNPSGRIQRLADSIKQSGEINPLIVAYEQWDLESGPYVLEGRHRFAALKLLGKKKFPALVALDTS